MFAAAAVLAVVVAIALLWPRGGPIVLPPPPDEASLTEAVRQHVAERHRAALAAPESTAAASAYCLALHADMLYAAAGACYDALVAAVPDEWRWRYYRALLRSDLGGGPDLLDDLRAVVDAAPDFAPAWLRLGDAALKARDQEAAEAAWRRTLDLPEPRRETRGGVTPVTEVPAAGHARLGLGRVQLERGELAEAERTAEALVAAHPTFSSAWRLLAEVHTRRGRAADAERALRRAGQLPPYAPYADPLVDALADESRNSVFLLRTASEANLATNGAWSEHLTRRALQFDPDNPDVVVKLGRVLRTLGRPGDALVYFRRYHELVPGDYQGLAHIGTALSELGRFEEAEPWLRRALEGLDDAVTHYNLGLLLARTGRLDAAAAEYRLAIARDGDDVNARSNLAAVLVRQGRLDQAIAELTEVIALDPASALAHANLGFARAQRGDTAGARRALQTALQLDPNLTPAADALRELPAR